MRYPRNFTKQNADAQIDYRPWKWLNVGALYDWERWDRDFRNVAVTNENTGKIFADSTWGFSTLRASLQYGQRRYNDYINFDGANNDAFRMKDLANRDRTKGLVSWAVDVTDMLTVTPNGGFRYDDYQTDIEFFTPGEIGLKKDHSWNAGIDATLHVSPAVAFFVSYMYEHGYRQVFENASPPKADVATTDTDHTFIVGSKITVIPQKLFINTNFTYTRATSQWDLGCTPAGCQYDPLAVYPDVHNNLTRLDMPAKYMLDDSFCVAPVSLAKPLSSSASSGNGTPTTPGSRCRTSLAGWSIPPTPRRPIRYGWPPANRTTMSSWARCRSA